MPYSIRQSVDMILNSSPKLIDLGKVNDKYFINIFSCGFQRYFSQKTPVKHKNTFGKLAYYFTGLKELPNFKKLNLSVHSQNMEIFLALPYFSLFLMEELQGGFGR